MGAQLKPKKQSFSKPPVWCGTLGHHTHTKRTKSIDAKITLNLHIVC